jgi:hypothetical protein
VVLELPAPGRQDASDTREVCPDETLVFGEPCEGERRGVEHGVVREALMGAEKGTQGLRDGEGEEAVRPGKLFLQVVVEPLLRCMMLTLGTVSVATGILDAVFFPTAVALREAMAVVSAAAVLDGADDLAVRGGEGGIALQVLGSKGGEDSAQGGHGRSPCMSELIRS